MKKEKTMHELVKEFPNKSYRELEIYREKDRQQEAGICIIGEARKDREPQSDLDRIGKENNDLYNRVAELIEISESHQKLNGKLQERLTEIEEENKRLQDHIDKQLSGARKSGM